MQTSIPISSRDILNKCLLIIIWKCEIAVCSINVKIEEPSKWLSALWCCNVYLARTRPPLHLAPLWPLEEDLENNSESSKGIGTANCVQQVPPLYLLQYPALFLCSFIKPGYRREGGAAGYSYTIGTAIWYYLMNIGGAILGWWVGSEIVDIISRSSFRFSIFKYVFVSKHTVYYNTPKPSIFCNQNTTSLQISDMPSSVSGDHCLMFQINWTTSRRILPQNSRLGWRVWTAKVSDRDR